MVLPAFIFGLAAALVLTPLVRFFARKYGVLDHPKNPRKSQPHPVALLGGIAVLAAFAIGVALSRHGLLGGFLLPKQLLGILAGGLILVAGGALDDRFDLPPRLQIVFPVLASLTVIASGIGATVITNPLGGSWRLDAWSFELFRLHGLPYHLTLPADLLTFAWMMGMTYTTKLLDGLDGLVSGLGVIGFAVLAIYSLTPAAAEPELARLAMIGAGALGGFLFYNARPASIYLGEGGSTLVGFLLGVLAILAGAKIGVMLMIVAIPLIDAAWTIVRRARQGRAITEGGLDHLHFLLVRGGISPGWTTFIYWAFAAAFGGAGIFIPGRWKLLGFAFLGILYAAIAYALKRRLHDRADH